MGSDVDFTFYSWTYFEAGQHAPSLSSVHELFVRWSLMMPRGPIPTILYAQGVGEYQESGELKSKFTRYGKFGFNALSITKGILEHLTEKPPAWGDIGDGLHTTTRYGEAETPQRKKSLGVFYRNWHPGPLGFQVAADAIAWRFAVAGIRAAELLADGAHYDHSPQPVPFVDLGPAQCEEVDEHKQRPPPLMRSGFCSANALPSCINHELPTFGTPQIQSVAVDDTQNPMISRTVTDVEVRAAPNSTLIPVEERNLEKCMHADHCRGARSRFMTYVLPKMTVGHIKVCCPQLMGGECGDLLLNATYFLGKKQLLNAREDNPRKCVIVQEQFPVPNSAESKGPSYLSISWGPEILSHLIPYISHVISL